MNEADSLMESMNSWGFAVNARIAFNKFIKAIEKENGVTDEVQKIFNIIDDIVLEKEKEQFIVELTKNSRYYRARIINAEDDEDLSKGVGKTTEGKFQGYNEMNSREPLLGISGEGRNNISGASYLYLASNPETACMEVKSQFGDLISLATFELTEPLLIIDFASDNGYMENVAELTKPPFDKPVSFIKLFDAKTRTVLMATINQIRENAVQISAS